MPIPSAPELMRPVLAAHADGASVRIEQLVERVAPEIGISEQERNEQQPSGDLVFPQRLGWARNYLAQLGYVDRPARGETRITDVGRRALDSNDPIPLPPADWAAKPVSRSAVLEAIDKFRSGDRDAILSEHGFKGALDYVVAYDGQNYDAKALYGIAYSIQYPDEEPIRNRGLKGGRGVNRKLEELGFTIKSLRSGPAAEVVSTGGRVWLIRAGRQGRYEQLALDQDVCLIGWSDLGEIPPDASRDDLKARIAEVYGEASSASLASQAGQVYRFVHEVAIDDLVVLPLMTTPGHVALGEVRDSYEYREDGPFEGTDARHTRPVEWLAKSLPYERFDSDLREAFGQQGTISEITKPNAAQRIIDVLGGADASAVHLVLKWSPSTRPDTIELHQEVAEEHGAVWWGRQSKQGTTGLGGEWLAKIGSQLEKGSQTIVFLYSSASTWRTRLLAIAVDTAEVEPELVPAYYDPDIFHSLWVKLADFEQVEPSEITDDYVLANSGDPVTIGGLGNQTPLIIRRRSSTVPGRFFILNQGQGDQPYEDTEGERYHWTTQSSGASKQLGNSPGSRFIYYRTGAANDGTSKSYFGSGRIASVSTEEREDGLQHFVASIEDFERFAQPVPFAEGPSRNAQTSIQPITRVQFEKLLKAGGKKAAAEFNIESIRAAAEAAGLALAPEIYAQLLAALESGKHVILTGPPGTAKTTLAQAVAQAAQAADKCDSYVLTTATADWTTYETIGGLRPTGPNTLDFEEGHFLKAIRANQWLVIDELNRSQFDRAFGQLFTVLSGQPVVLPYYRPEVGPSKPLVLVPEGVASPLADGDVLEIPQSWRVLATMNVFDKTLLFEMSFALMRRFAFIEVASPSLSVFESLIEQQAAGPEPASLAKRLLPVRELKDLGPAVFMDLAKFLRERLALDHADDGQLLFEAFYSYLLPQFEGVDAATGERLFQLLAPLMASSARRNRLRETLNAVLGLELQPPSQVVEVEEPDDEDVEQPDE
jgi:MoxR-like ATPase